MDSCILMVEISPRRGDIYAMKQRNIRQNIAAALADTPVVLLNGARQTGKSTLARTLADERGGQYLSMDEPLVAAAASADPDGFVQGLGGFTVLDEAQTIPALFGALKREVDRRRQPGRFLLTGSANIFLLPRVAESLAGRMEVLTLWPLSMGECAGTHEDFPAWAFGDTAPPPGVSGAGEPETPSLRQSVAQGGFPEILQRTQPARRWAWYDAYLGALLQRDLRDLSSIEGLVEMPRLLGLLAARGSGLLNMAELSRSTGIAHTTLRRYLALLEATFLFQPLPAWSANLGNRLVKAPKVHLLDTGLALRLLGRQDLDDPGAAALVGPLFESLVVQEVRKQLGWSTHPAQAFHYRSGAGEEIDLLLEDRQGLVVAIEVKSSTTVSPADFRALRSLRDALGDRFRRGVLLHGGRDTVPLGDRLWALPLTALWHMDVSAPH